MNKLIILLAWWMSVLPTQAQEPPIQIVVDLTETARHLYHAEIDLPVAPGPATFTTPLWLPASHQPNGSIGSIVGVVFTAGGQTLEWRRDDLALAEFHVTIPAGVLSVHVHLDAIASRTTRNIGMLEWESLLLYPAHVPVRQIAIQPSVTVPTGWGVGTALSPLDKVATLPTAGVDECAHAPDPRNSVTTRYAVTTVDQRKIRPF